MSKLKSIRQLLNKKIKKNFPKKSLIVNFYKNINNKINKKLYIFLFFEKLFLFLP
jgi:hypothetical protein